MILLAFEWIFIGNKFFLLFWLFGTATYATILGKLPFYTLMYYRNNDHELKKVRRQIQSLCTMRPLIIVKLVIYTVFLNHNTINKYWKQFLPRLWLHKYSQKLKTKSRFHTGSNNKRFATAVLYFIAYLQTMQN